MSTASVPARRPAPGGPLAPLLDAARPRLVELLGRPGAAERMAQAAITVYQGSDQLRACDPESILAAVFECCTLRLELTPALGHAYLVPYGKTCKLMPGYRGFLELVRRGGHFDLIQAREVREGEDFEVEYNPGLTLHHKPRFDLPRQDPSNVLYVYAYAKTMHGGELVQVMTWQEVEQVRARSKCANRGPWVTDWLAMALKTVLRRFLKTQPSTPELARAYEFDNQHFDYDDPAPAPIPQNQSGYGKGKHAGRYASPEQTTAYLTALRGFVDRANERYLDSAALALSDPDGSYPPEIREPLNIHQADGHLLKWAVASGRLDEAIVPEDAKVRQLGRYTAIVYHRGEADKSALVKEMNRYAVEQARLAWEKLRRKRPDLFPDDDRAEPEPVPAEDLSQDPDHDPEAEAAYWDAREREEAAR